MFFFHLGGPANGHAAGPGHAEETPGVSSVDVGTVCSTLNLITRGVPFSAHFICAVFLSVFNRPEEERAANRHHRH